MLQTWRYVGVGVLLHAVATIRFSMSHFVDMFYWLYGDALHIHVQVLGLAFMFILLLVNNQVRSHGNFRLCYLEPSIVRLMV